MEVVDSAFGFLPSWPGYEAINFRVSNRKYEGVQNHSAAAFSSRTHLGKLQITL